GCQAKNPREESCHYGFVGAVTQRRILALLAAAEPDGLVAIGFIGFGRQACSLVGSVAERLILAAPAGTPEIGLARLDIDFKGFPGCDNWLIHHRLPSLAAL